MASGVVRGLVPIVPVSVMGKDGAPRRFQAIMDTGFTGTVALPVADVRRLGLSNPQSQQVTFANEESGNCDVYPANVVWNGETQPARLYAVGAEPLVGMALLRGSRVTMDIAEGGPVVIEPL